MCVAERVSKVLLVTLFLTLDLAVSQQSIDDPGSQVRLFKPAERGSEPASKESGGNRAEGARSLRSDYYSGSPSEKFLDLGLFGRPYYGSRGYPSGGYYPQGGGYLPQGGYYPQSGGFYPNSYPGASGYFPGTNSIGGSPGGYGGAGYGGYGGGYSGYGGYGGYGGNGGLQSYLGYNSGNYFGTRNVGYGYYSGTNPAGISSSSLVSGFRGYN